MNKILDFVNSKYKDSFRFDRCEKLSDDFNGSKIYHVTSKARKNLYVGMPVLIKETNGELEEIISHKEIITILNSIV
jgi:hypothetical protein